MAHLGEFHVNEKLSYDKVTLPLLVYVVKVCFCLFSICQCQ